MRNAAGRDVPQNPYGGAFAKQVYRTYICDKEREATVVFGLKDAVAALGLRDGMTLSFHHHLRAGDRVLEQVMDAVRETRVKGLTIAASAIFPAHRVLVDRIADKTVRAIETAYISGPVAEAVSRGLLDGGIRMVTHGGRARAILEGDCPIDVAFIAAPAVDRAGRISGVLGRTPCGPLGYAAADAWKADIVVAVTDDLRDDEISDADIEAGTVDIICVVDKLGEAAGIVSGTTRITHDPVGLRIAADAAALLEKSGLFRNGLSFQTGAGGISLAVARFIQEKMKSTNIVGSFGSGGITEAFTDMLHEGLLGELFDVQAFDLAAVKSSREDPMHHRISASRYANPNDPEAIVSRLDAVVLGASEIDLDFNVNVTTGSDGMLLGGSGGHADTAAGAKLTMIVSKLVNARVSCLQERVTTVTTPGETVDVLVTDRGIAVNPRRPELLARLRADTHLDIVEIGTLYERAVRLTGKPAAASPSGREIGVSVYRDGTIIDVLKAVR